MGNWDEIMINIFDEKAFIKEMPNGNFKVTFEYDEKEREFIFETWEKATRFCSRKGFIF